MSSEVLSPDEQVASTSALADLFEKPTTTTRGAKYSCSVCAKQFRSKYTRDDHELSHTDEKPFICETCDMKFSSRSGLGLHTNIHLRKYVCSICGKACQSPGILQSHEASHRGQKEHSCPKCERKFSQKSSVTRHALTCGQTMTNSPESYKLACEQCGKRFKTRDVYRHHMNLHLKRFKCDICDRNCNSLYALRKHNQTHTGQKDFFCDHCGRGFINKTHKIRHEKKCALLKKQAKNEFKPATIFKKEDPHRESEGLAIEQELPTSDHTVTDQDEHSDHRMSMDLMEEHQHSTSITPTTDEEEVFITNDDLGLPRKRCVFCWKDTHLADDCRRYSHVPDRWALRTRFLLCAVCLTLHPNKPCPADLVSPCTHCEKDDHHVSLCRSDRHQQFLMFP